MQARTYISIQGSSFNPQEFDAQGGSTIGGEVRKRKHTGAPLTNVPLDFWSSKVSQGSSDDVSQRLAILLKEVAPFVVRLSDRSGLRIYAHVVLEFDQGEEPAGLFFSTETIALLNDVGAELDIDAVPRL
jgi:hypothetical protein